MSNDDRLLKALGQLAREQDATAEPPRELLSPPSPDVVAQIATRGLASLDKSAPAPATGTAVTSIDAARARRKRWTWTAAVAGPLALAASALLYVNSERGPALPAYSISITGGLAEQRSSAGTAPALLLEPGAPVEIVLRPQAPTSESLDAHLYWVQGDRVQRWPVEAERSPEGALRLRGRALSPFGPGDGQLTAVIAPAGSLPATATARDLTSPRKAWQVFHHPVHWRR
jgi:hypothetical protein